MTFLIWFAVIALLVQLASIAFVIATRMLHRRGAHRPISKPPVTLIRPICGLENNLERCLASSFRLDWPSYELLFCVARADDPAAALAQRLMAENPHIPARLLVGEDLFSVNPKMNNVVKGWRNARHDWVVMTDSNVLMPPDTIARMMARWDGKTGLVCSPPAGTEPTNFGAMLESTWLDSFQARWQLFADAAGFGFAQGKSMLFNRHLITELGGFERLGEEVAEDAAATILIRNAGLKVRLVREPFPQPLGNRDIAAVWKRQLRWARLRRASFPLYFLPEVFTGATLPMAAMVALALNGNLPAWTPLAYLMAWYGAEVLLARTYGWPTGWRMLPAMLARDLLLPALFVSAWFGSGFEWRGNAMTVADNDNGRTTRIRQAVARTRDKAREKARALVAARSL
ncbi:ceramide glucosyltransferase [Rhizobium wuzhouense]|uniref:Ceramide glucosyltransferase n=1 Tax=Rhizobium wuzhouense TaxID=1986026 RepID=A0ABX5NQW4_9HYPH|nr:ceramide glucosyltransferase [Rhizobium wuzhouense]PYB73175.1 ceramide glucosyltransferase [Rhizobium wuzhouense]